MFLPILGKSVLLCILNPYGREFRDTKRRKRNCENKCRCHVATWTPVALICHFQLNVHGICIRILQGFYSQQRIIISVLLIQKCYISNVVSNMKLNQGIMKFNQQMIKPHCLIITYTSMNLPGCWYIQRDIVQPTAHGLLTDYWY